MKKENFKRRWRIYMMVMISGIIFLSAFTVSFIKSKPQGDLSTVATEDINIQSTGETSKEKNNTETNTEDQAATVELTPEPTRPVRLPLNKEVSIGNVNKKQIALTLDGGSSATQTPRILDILKENNIKVTFFITGKWAEENPALIKRMVSEGHTLGNHTYDHKDLTTLSDQEIKAEFERTESIVTNISSNITLKPYFRPPYGARNQHVWDYTASLGYQSIYWTVDAWDWKTDVSAQIVKQRIFDNVKNGAIILMHVGDDITPAILSEVITNLEAKGFTLGNLESVLAD